MKPKLSNSVIIYSKNQDKIEEKELEKAYSFVCGCGIEEKEKNRVYGTSKGTVCTKCFLNMI